MRMKGRDETMALLSQDVPDGQQSLGKLGRDPHGTPCKVSSVPRLHALFLSAAELMSISSPAGFHDSWEDLAQNINCTYKSFPSI